MKGSILVVDDEKNQRILIADFLREKGHRVSLSESGDEAMKLIRDEHFDLVISDYKMKKMNGIALLTELKLVNPLIGVIIISAFGTVETAVEAMKRGADDFIVKPINLEQLHEIAQRSLFRHALIRENVELKKKLSEKYRFDRIIGESGSMQETVNVAARAASSKATIMIRGESGTGKGLLANAIHFASDRASGPFIEINCAALALGVLESELFGHEKGAFTGADRAKPGRFELADGGTLFIDEVGDIPREIQVKLLNVLQTGSYMRVGGIKSIRGDVRIIAATHRNLEAMIRDGSFREDLYFRLNVVALVIPPLRQRRSDIPLLVEHLIRVFTTQNNKIIKGISAQAMNCLMRYDYPGNVRELENAIMRATLLAREESIELTDLPITIRSCLDKAAASAEFELGGSSLPETIANIEIKAITTALQKAGGVQTKAAVILGISERNLRYKIEKYGLTSP